MLLYNVTITIDLEVHQDWLRWMRETHIPDVLATGLFSSCRICRLLEHEHRDAEIFTMQYQLESAEQLQRYMKEFAPELQRQHQERFAGKFTAFRTVMEVLG